MLPYPDIPDDLPRGTFNVAVPSRIIFRSVEQLRRIPPECYRIIMPSEPLYQFQEEKARLWDDLSSVLARQNDWDYDAHLGRVIAVWMSLQ